MPDWKWDIWALEDKFISLCEEFGGTPSDKTPSKRKRNYIPLGCYFEVEGASFDAFKSFTYWLHKQKRIQNASLRSNWEYEDGHEHFYAEYLMDKSKKTLEIIEQKYVIDTDDILAEAEDIECALEHFAKFDKEKEKNIIALIKKKYLQQYAYPEIDEDEGPMGTATVWSRGRILKPMRENDDVFSIIDDATEAVNDMNKGLDEFIFQTICSGAERSRDSREQ